MSLALVRQPDQASGGLRSRPTSAAERVPMMADPGLVARIPARFDDDQVDANWQSRRGDAVRQTVFKKPADRDAQVTALAVIERLLGQAEVAAAPPAHLDDDESPRRTRIDRHEIKLVATDMDVPGENGPARRPEAIGNESFGGMARLLRPSPGPRRRWTIHGDSIALSHSLAIDR